jgi:5'-3' exonuclease
MEITQDSVAKEFAEGVQACTTVHELVEYGANLFTIPYVDSIIKQSWSVFSRRMSEIAPEDKGKSLVVIDFPGIFHAAFERDETTAISGTVDRIESAVESCGNLDSVVVAIDSQESFRRKKYQEYKANRTPKPTQFTPIRDEAIDKLKYLGCNVVSHEGWESDDVMASAAFRAKLRRHTCVIVTEDRDLLQCVGNGVTCYSPRAQEYRSETWLKANHSLTPKQVVDWLCLMGKDNAPAAAGIGEKTATTLLAKLGNFWSIFESLEALVEQKELTRKRADSINEFARSGNYFIARELHELNRNLEVNW